MNAISPIVCLFCVSIASNSKVAFPNSIDFIAMEWMYDTAI